MASKKKTKEERIESTLAAAVAGIDREALAPKTRLYALAKQVGVASKELVAQFAEMGIKKSAQSTLTPEEVGQLIDVLVPATEAPEQAATEGTDQAAATADAAQTPEEPVEETTEAPAEEKPEKTVKKKRAKRAAKRVSKAGKKAEPKGQAGEPTPEEPAAQPEQPEQLSEEEEKLRERVRKNVDNEISQIVDKVDAEMLHEALVEAGDSAEDEDLTPLITPMAEEDPDVYDFAPVFMAPKITPLAKCQKPEKREEETEEDSEPVSQPRGRRRGSRGTSRGRGAESRGPAREEVEHIEEPKAIKGSTRIEAQRRRRAELREKGRERQHIVSQAEFLARRESVERTMVVRDKQRTDGAGIITQVGVLEDDLLVEHFVTTETHPSQIGNIYLGRVQNVLPSMEAAFVDIGQGRNGVLYAGDIDWRALGIGGRGRKVENALKSGDQVLVQVAKDPIGHKGARLTTQISLAGRFLVYVPGGRSAGISRKLPVPERKRLKGILERVIPGDGGAIIRTAAENVSEEDIASDVNRLHSLWEDISARAAHEKATKGAKPVTLYEEPDLLIKVVRDLFNEDFSTLVVDGKRSYNTVSAYVDSMAHDLADRVVRYDARDHDGEDAFSAYRIDEQLQKALGRKVWLPSGGTLVIDRTEAMTVIDVNTGKFTGSGGNLEETVTRNNLEAAEEIVRQMRLRDIGGMIVVDFIDMVLPENQDLVLRRLKEALGRDRTRHQVSEVTSLGLVQMTRKRVGTGLIETFSTECEACHGRGIIIHEYPVDEDAEEENSKPQRRGRKERRAPQRDPKQHPAAVRMHRDDEEAAEHETATEKEASRDDESSLEELVANVVVVDEDEPDTPDSASIGYAVAESLDAKRSKPKSKAKRSRKPRRATRTFREPQREETSEGSSAKHGKRDEHAGAEKASNQRSEQTYDEAVEAFEKSPRRKRRTRGNSRSDIRPKREDFAQDETPAKDAQLATSKKEAKAERKGAEPGENASVRATRSRGRRRVVRKMAQSQSTPASNERGQGSEAQRRESSAQTTASKARKGGRGRRRVARRRSR
ncbi:ribonuclease E [Corynebacterium sp. HMSC062E11]|uniref:translation initiation factor IF-2 N-terminal domain-containing protein n=1 Tax=Corynebacterium TaxID=1716 RepID=UPI0008A5716A|nr:MULTISPECIES: translation initiation factor IF-2 N-terminal domain-containing protein [unclassified Corynebacterium]MDK6807078.1 translation initiation factor IF-2 N-terminal domain-containing protein [Corynebacterium aurimucosum]NJJ82917.1 Rne/Rng family ribonuclease [Corynebacterium aurimucosum]OFK30328.1 ribonuclease E [Corynebacterium sp. HMSC062E11]OFP73538.1 ribonuclease E [Corynebacterium sp. HMSC078C09]OFQ93290.1 ribonuclease E [Corynebacterium sp. HMSC056E09]